MTFRKQRLVQNLKLLIPAYLLFLVVFAGIGLSFYLDHRSSKPEAPRAFVQKTGPSTVKVDGVYRATLPCPYPEGPKTNETGGASTVTYTCALVKSDGSLDRVFFASNKSYSPTATITPAADYAFCGTYTNDNTGEVMTDQGDVEQQVDGRTFRICTYKGNKGTLLYTAKTLTGNSLQTYTVFGNEMNMQHAAAEFDANVKDLKFL
jgi:hypothetical protein